ncbi:MAG: Arm DNA-binding domain-containing protein [Aeromonas sp.]|uniref:Arm DNA-binding domain-containing protein n=1 Tax=Aeromonas sp. TaxID=647 RepID=UPI003D6A631A
MALSDVKLRKIAGKPYDGPNELPGGQGLSARISPSGNISFQYRYRHGQRARRMSLGSYGDVTLKEARERHAEALRHRASAVSLHLYPVHSHGGCCTA